MTSKTPTILFYSILVLILGIFLLYPVAGVFSKTFFFGGSFSIGIFRETVSGYLVWSSLIRSVFLGCAAVILTACIAVPLAFFFARYDFPLKKYAAGIVLIPMIMPPFVGAIGIKRIFARYGLVNMLFGTEPFDWFSAAGFWGVAFLQALHLFPIMYLNITAALANIDPQLERASLSAGAGPRRVFRDITLPLAKPGLIAGSLIVFLWSFTDLGTPLVLGYRRVLAVEIFDRVASVQNDPTGPTLVVLAILVTVLFMAVFKKYSNITYDTASKGITGRDFIKPSAGVRGVIYAYIAVLLVLALLPHAGVMLTSVADDWFMTSFPSEYTLRFYSEAVSAPGVAVSVKNSVFYSSMSTLIDIVLGVMIAYFILRRRIAGGWLIDTVVMLPLALPGLILAFGYVASFSGTFLDPLANPVPLLIIGYAVRRLPFCFRSAYAGLQQIGEEYEHAARSAGASAPRAFMSVTVPLIGANIIAGAILSFMFAVLEVSESMVLAAKSEFFPVTREIYNLLGKIPDGDYVASALGMLCMLFLSAGLITASLLMGRKLGRMFRI